MNDAKGKDWLAERARKVMIENGFEPDFSPAAIEQARQVDETIEEAMGSVRDMRDLRWSSIDNASSRDLDQVEWAEELENGDIRVLVGIADVDSKIEKDTPIDRRARQNTVTVYTQSAIFPMLPERLSTDITSLNENEDRIAVVAEMIVKPNGDVPESKFFRAVVRNQAKLSYEDVGDWFDNGGSMPAELGRDPELRLQIELQKEAATRLHLYRQKKGALEFESIESQAVVEDGEIKGITSVVSNSARRLIENFMVAANVEMAEFLENHGSLSLRRVVKTPERWDGIVKIAAEFGDKLPDEPNQPALAEFLEKQRNADPEHFPDLSLSIIKLIGGGDYVIQRKGEDAGGHFGLAVDDYAHSTAPNRRFTDIVVQRLVKAIIEERREPYSGQELDAIADHANLQERAARKVERKMRKIVAANVMMRHIGESFDAIVTGVSNKGTYARILRPPIDGRIIKNERGLEVGEKVRVKLIDADPRNGFIDFERSYDK